MYCLYIKSVHWNQTWTAVSVREMTILKLQSKITFTGEVKYYQIKLYGQQLSLKAN